MISRFLDRNEELALLEEEWNKPNGRLIILYGRRRIGKTRLISEFLSGKNGIFFIAEETSPQIQINGLKEQVASFLADPLLTTLEMNDWEQLIGYLTQRAPAQRFFLAIDEFSYIIKSDRRILSVLQKYWDGGLEHSQIFIILAGSMLGLMSESVLSYASPLYGRRTRDILLEGFPFQCAREFLAVSTSEALKFYLCVGGVPAYLQKATEYTNFLAFLESEFASKLGYFYREPYYIISQEFRELRTYFSILNAIAYGNTRPTEIANYVGLGAREIYPYLENLLRLELIEREVSIAGNPKKGIYVIKDVVFDSWFNLVFKFREQIERGTFVLQEDVINTYLGKRFERFVSREIAPPLLPNHSKIGRWWDKDQEIDIIALDEDAANAVFLECKWSSLTAKDAKKIIRALKRKASFVHWHDQKRTEQYGIVARAIEGKDLLRDENYIAFDLDDLQQLLESGSQEIKDA